MFASRKAQLLAAVVIGFGSFATAAPAFAQSPGGTASANGSLTVTQNLAISYQANYTPFTFAPGPDNATAGGAYAGQIDVLSNDPAGYSVTEQATAFTAGSQSIPNTEFDGPTYAGNGNSDTYAEFGSNPLTFVNMPDDSLSGSVTYNGPAGSIGSTQPAGDDGFAVSNFILDPSYHNAPAGVYSGTVTFTLWGN